MSIEIPSLVSYSIIPTDVSEAGKMYVISIENGQFIKVSEGVKLLIDEIDGIKSYEEISKTLTYKYGVKKSADELCKFITGQLGPLGLLKGVEANSKLFSNGRLWYHIPLFDGKNLERFANKLTQLFRWKIVPIIILLTVVTIYLLVYSNVYIFSLQNAMYGVKEFLVTMALYFVTLLAHEFGHVTACYYYGVKPRSLGVGVYLLVPVFFVDLSETWVLNRKQRLITDLGGIYFQLIAIALLFPIVFINNGLFNFSVYKKILQLSLLTLFFNLNPLTRGDGYWILSDITGVVNIHKRVRESMVNTFRKLINSKRYNPSPTYELRPITNWFFRVWSIGYFIMIILLLNKGISRLIITFINGFDIRNIWGTLMFVIVILQFVLPLFKQRIKKDRAAGAEPANKTKKRTTE